MPIKSLRGTVVNAANVPLLGQVVLHGANTYTIGTNLISWDETNNYLLSNIAGTFGQAISGSGQEQLLLRCGDSAITPYDFGLLFSCFVGMNTAYAESGISLTVCEEDTTSAGIYIVWFGNYGILYSYVNDIIIPIRSSDIQRACKFNEVTVSNFTDSRVFELKREGTYLVIGVRNSEILCKVKIAVNFIKAYPQLFSSDIATEAAGRLDSWDKNSQLGSLIAGSVQLTDVESTIEKYKEQAMLDSVVVREDLMCTPSKRYSSTKELFGSIAYNDKNSIVMAVNFRNNLFIYQPWFTATGLDEVQTDSSPKFNEFFNVTEECERITRYASTVTRVPLTAAEFDTKVFERVKNAFFGMELPRVQFSSTFGKIVIPEPVLVNAISSMSGESVYCIVPVGSIGGNVICKNSDGELITMEVYSSDSERTERIRSWDFNTFFYDITEVVECATKS